jgi:hypothetical protein
MHLTFQRAVEKYDQVPEEYLNGDKPIIKYFKSGHQGILSLNDRKPDATTYVDDYVYRERLNSEEKGTLLNSYLN